MKNNNDIRLKEMRPSQNDIFRKGVEFGITETLKEVRNDIYNRLPKGHISAGDMLEIVSDFIDSLDSKLDK